MRFMMDFLSRLTAARRSQSRRSLKMVDWDQSLNYAKGGQKQDRSGARQ
jgi:hypothetical protein